jgi:hypothetical protein
LGGPPIDVLRSHRQQIEVNDQDKSKSTGVLYPAAQLILDKQGQLQLDLNQNPWRLVDILDWKGTPGVN